MFFFKLTLYIYTYFYIKLQERFIKIQLVPANKCYPKFKYVSDLSKL